MNAASRLWPTLALASPPRVAIPAPASASAPVAHLIGRLAVRALYDELALSPKPGLVTLVDTGSHDDMDAHTFMRSLLALRPYFVEIAQLGALQQPFLALQRSGLAAEQCMLRATAGVNTHRGAIFMLGLLCAAAGAVDTAGLAWTPQTLRRALQEGWGTALAERALQPPTLPGGLAAQRHGLRSAAQEAAAGFPVLFEVAVPALWQALARGLSWELARLETLFAVMAVLDDSNVAHRGGLQGLREVQAQAQAFLVAGGAAQPGAVAAAQRIGAALVQRRLSPGGAADTLGAACWVLRLSRCGGLSATHADTGADARGGRP